MKSRSVYYVATFEIDDGDDKSTVVKRFRETRFSRAADRAQDYASGFSDGAASAERTLNMELVSLCKVEEF